MKPLPFSRYSIALGSIGFVAVFVTACFSTFRYTSICSECGCIRGESDWQLPRSSHTYFHTTDDPTRTPFTSAIANADGSIPPHTHHWMFSSGGGNGVRCALGEGAHLRQAMQSPVVAAFLKAVRAFRGPADFDQCLAYARSPDTAVDFAMEVECWSLPARLDRQSFNRIVADKAELSELSTVSDVDLTFLLAPDAAAARSDR